MSRQTTEWRELREGDVKPRGYQFRNRMKLDPKDHDWIDGAKPGWGQTITSGSIKQYEYRAPARKKRERGIAWISCKRKNAPTTHRLLFAKAGGFVHVGYNNVSEWYCACCDTMHKSKHVTHWCIAAGPRKRGK